jgi:hypothetical protein
MRAMVFWVAALAVVGWYYLNDPDGGRDTVLRLQWLAWVIVVAGPVYILRRALMDGARSLAAFKKALEDPVGAGIAFCGLCILTGLLFLALVGQANGAEIPERAKLYMPVLNEEVTKYWPEAEVATLAGQVEQETCPSLVHKKCWNPNTELKTSREYGFGLGQLTVTKKYDNFAAARGLDQSLVDWKWEDRYDARRQLRTMVLMDRAAWVRLKGVTDRMEMTLAAYNGGLGGVLADRRLCASIPGCDPNKWWGNVELHSMKSRVKPREYGKSFFEINREYPRNVMGFRRERYL